MNRKTYLVILTILFSISQILASSSLAGFKKTEIAVKFTAEAMAVLDKNKPASGLTGMPEFDALNSDYRVNKVAAHFQTLSQNKINMQNSSLQQWYKIYFRDEVDVQAVAGAYEALSSILQAEPIPIHNVHGHPNDTHVSSQWHIDQTNDVDIDAPEAWDVFSGGSDIIVAVMDTGVEWFHQDLAGSFASASDRNSIRGNIWINQAEMNDTTSTIDEDGNGYNDDWVGWDFVTGNPQILDLGDDYEVADNDPRDKESHGTHCAGNVGAINNNDRGVCSAAGGWGEDSNGYGNGVKIMSLRIGWSDFSSGRVSMDFASEAFLYAEANGAHIASCSWGSSDYGPFVDAVNTFLYGKTNPGAGDPKLRLIFVAAGNDGTENADYLAGRDDAIAVAATQSDDNAATGFTTYGAWIDISAPGDNIYSTKTDGGYVSYSGTSMSTPMAASVAALLWSYKTSLSAPDVETYLYSGADNIEGNLSSKYQGKMGAGRVNARQSLDLIDSPSGILRRGADSPGNFNLAQNYPNPFNPTTIIRYRVETRQCLVSTESPVHVELTVYNTLGQKVRTLVNRMQGKGNYSVTFDATGLTSGIYFYKLQAAGQKQIRRMILMR